MWQLSKNKNWTHLRDTFSWIQYMEGVPQDPIWHAEGDVATHTKMVAEELLKLPAYQTLEEEKQEILFAAALFHDIEKRSTTVVEDNGRITSKRHAKKGEFTTRSILYRHHETPFAIKEMIAKLVRYHGLPLWIFEKPNPQKALFQASHEVDTHLLSILTEADIRGRICHDQEELLYKNQLFKAFCMEQGCFGTAKTFMSNLARYEYFKKENVALIYEPYEQNHFEVILLSGLPGSGKDTYIKEHLSHWPVISLDQLRRTHKIKPGDKKGTGRIIQMAKEQARSYLRKKESFIWNATNLSKKIRKQLIDLFATYQAKTKIVYLEIPYVELIQRNKSRAFPVPYTILEKMIANLEVPAVWEAWELEKIFKSKKG